MALLEIGEEKEGHVCGGEGRVTRYPYHTTDHTIEGRGPN
jgi:hypothetical protein